MASSGDFDADYIENRRARLDEEVNEMRAELERTRLAAEAAAARAATAPAPDAAAAPAAATATPEATDADAGKRGYMLDIGISALDGVVDAGRETIQTITPKEWEKWLDENLNIQDQAETVPGQLAHGVAQFTTGFIPALRVARWAGLGLRLAAPAAGAVADFFTFDPHEARLSNLAVEAGWGLDNPITQALRTNPDDGEVEGRVKNALEGLALGGVADGVMRGAKWLYSKNSARNALARAASEGKITVDQASDTSLAASRVTMLRDQLDDLEVAANKITEADRKATDEILRKKSVGEALTPEEAARIEAGEFRAGTSGEPLEDAVRAQGAGELSALDEAAKTNPELVERLRGMLKQDGDLNTSRARVAQELDAAEEDYLKQLSGLDRDTAEELVKKVDNHLAPSSLDRSAKLAARAGEVVDRLETKVSIKAGLTDEAGDTLVSSVVRPGIKMSAIREARLLGAIKDGVDLNEAVKHFDVTNYANIGVPGEVEKVVRSLAALISNEEKAMRSLGIAQPHATTEGRALQIIANERAELETEGIVGALIGKVLPGVKELAAKVTALRLTEMSLASTVTRLGKAITGGGGGSPEQLVEFMNMHRLLANMNDVRRGVSTEIGRALEAHKIIARADVQLLGEQLQDILETNGGEAAIRKAAKWWAEGGDRLNGAQRTRQLQKERPFSRKVRDAVVEYWLNSILSGPITQVVNFGSNTAVGLYLPAEHLLGGIAQGNMKAASQAVHMYAGMTEGFRATLNLVDMFANSKEGFGFLAKGQLGSAKGAFGRALTAGSFGRSLKTGQLETVGDFARQYDLPVGRAISGESLGMKTGIAARLVDATGTVVSLPTRSLTAFDELAKGINYHMNISMHAYEAATARGLSGQTAESFRRLIHNKAQLWHTLGANDEIAIARALAIEPAEVRGFLKSFDNRASQYARYSTFTEALAEGSLSRTMQKGINQHPMLRFVAPFIRTPMNILKFITERMPTQAIPGVRRVIHPGAAGVKVRAALAKGGAEAEAAKSRILVGSMMWTVAATAAYSGHITGSGPSNRQEREAKMATGWRPYSVAVLNDDGSKRYVAFNRLDPFAGFLGLAADYAEIMGNADQNEMDDVAMELVLATSQMMLSKSYFVGLSGALSAAANPDRSGKSFAQRFVGSWVPAFLDQTQLLGSDEHDSAGRAIRDAAFNREIKIGDGKGTAAGAATFVAQSMDWMRQVLANRVHVGENPPRRNLYGEIVAYPPGWGPDIASPFYVSDEKNDPIDRKIRELSERGEGVRIDTRAQFAQIGSGDIAIPLSAQQQERLALLASEGTHFRGVSMRAALNKLVSTRGFDDLGIGGQGLGEGGQVNVIERVITARIARAKEIFLRENPEIARERHALRVGARLSRGKRSQEEINQIMDSIRTR